MGYGELHLGSSFMFFEENYIIAENPAKIYLSKRNFGLILPFTQVERSLSGLAVYDYSINNKEMNHYV
ncbi:hypothetical protein CSA56_05820 [candidate division KSB3 bacterium]|uniref:Uncharacterized protein n=1 Tax=candidate division KSB3 bacterium TaxID=2044937 RepID=A0A2G6KHB8_9BACT|nr:MAG: hypothetical protein CSA56_05820 [candidate division KSB3 bacterium]